MRAPWLWSLLAFLLAFLAGCGVETAPLEGRQAPPIQATTLDGGALSLADLRGKPAVIVFWASWCGPCRQEAPEVARLAAGYAGKVAFVGVNAGESAPIARRAVQEWPIPYPVVLDEAGKAQTAYEVTAIPLVLVLDGDGIVRYRGFGLPPDAHRLLDGLLG